MEESSKCHPARHRLFLSTVNSCHGTRRSLSDASVLCTLTRLTEQYQAPQLKLCLRTSVVRLSMLQLSCVHSIKHQVLYVLMSTVLVDVNSLAASSTSVVCP